MTVNDRARIIENVGKLAAKYFSREDLRDLCRDYDIHFNLRSTKPNMARSIVNYWLLNNMTDKIKDVIEGSYDYWQGKIDKKDPHRPGYYVMMRDIAVHSQELMEELKIKAGA